MREKTNMHLHSRNGRRTFAASFALWVMVLALALSPLASCNNPGNSGEPEDPGDSGISAKPEELLKLDSDIENFHFVGIDENWIYYLIGNYEDSTSTLWRANKDGTDKSAISLVPWEKIDSHNCTPANGRLYYIPDSYDGSHTNDGIYSSTFDFSETSKLTGHANSLYSNLNVVGEWIYFVRTDRRILPDGQYVEAICRMKLGGSDMSEIATTDGSFYFLFDGDRHPLVAGSRIYYGRSVGLYGSDGWVIAMRDVQGSEETIIFSSDKDGSIGPIRYSNGSIFYSRNFPNANEEYEYLICSLDTEAPYSEKTLLTGTEVYGAFDVAFVEDGWVYYGKWDMTGSAPTELWRIRTDGTGSERLSDYNTSAYYLANDGGYIYYEAYSLDDHVSTLYRMKTP